jgi:GNAT superfamily N-acetyltransferase
MDNVVARRLAGGDREALITHFRALSDADRRLRFGVPVSDASIVKYVTGIDRDRDVVYGVHADDLSLAGVAHVARSEHCAEIGVSVLDGWRNQGFGSALFGRATSWARNQGIGTMFMHCLAENAVIMRIAKRTGMRIVTSSGEADAYLKLSPADLGSASAEMLQDNVALFDYLLKHHFLTARRLYASMSTAM